MTIRPCTSFIRGLVLVILTLRAVAAPWEQMPGQAKAIAVGPKGTAYVIGTDDLIYQWTGKEWERIGERAVAISACGGREPSAPESLFMVAADGSIRRYRAGSWETLPGKASAVSLGTDGKMWIMDAETDAAGNHRLSEWNPATLQWDSTNGGTGARMTVGARGSVWTVNAQYEIYQLLAGAWTKKPGNARDITVAPAGEMWVVGTNNLENGEADSSIYRGAADGTVWESIEGEGVRIAAGPEYLWVVNSKGEIFRQPWRAVTEPAPTGPGQSTGPERRR
jgi:hypothetical protein